MWVLKKLWWARGDSNARPLPCQGSSGQSLTEIDTENERVTLLSFGPQMDLSPSLDLTRTSHTDAANGTTFAPTRAVVPAFLMLSQHDNNPILLYRTIPPRALGGSQGSGRCEVKLRCLLGAGTAFKRVSSGQPSPRPHGRALRLEYAVLGVWVVGHRPFAGAPYSPQPPLIGRIQAFG